MKLRTLSPWGLFGLVLLPFCVAVPAVSGDDSGTSPFSFNVYGTLGLVHSSDNDADYIAHFWRPHGVGHSHDWSADIDSRIGVQVSADFTDKFSAIAQVVSEQDHNGSYRPHLDWANIKFELTPDFSLRAGRIIQPSFLYADSRKISYSYPWVRPPTELYFLVPVTNNDGIDLSYRMHFGEVMNTIDISYGQLDTGLPDRLGGGDVNMRETAAIVTTLERGPLTVRLSYHQSSLSIPGLKPLFNAFRQFGPEGVAIADRFDLHDSRVKFYGLGFNYDPGHWFIVSEVAQTLSRSIIGESLAWHLSSGVRIGSLTPFVSYAQLDITSETSTPGLSLSLLPPPLQEPAAALNNTLNGILKETAAQQTVAVGMRWDFMRNVALKLQWEYISRSDNSPGTFVDLQPGFDVGGNANLFSVSVDFVF